MFTLERVLMTTYTGRSRFHCLPSRKMLMGKFPGWYLAYDKYNATHKVRVLSMAAMSKVFWFSRINCVADFPTCSTTAIEDVFKVT